MIKHKGKRNATPLEDENKTVLEAHIKNGDYIFFINAWNSLIK